MTADNESSSTSSSFLANGLVLAKKIISLAFAGFFWYF